MPSGIKSQTNFGGTKLSNTRMKGGDRNIDDPRYKMFHNAKHRAKKRGIKFTITMDDIVIPETCPLLGLKLDSWTGVKGHPCNPSLDQKKPGEGYTPENVWVISSRANWLKADATRQELVTLLENWERAVI